VGRLWDGTGGFLAGAGVLRGRAVWGCHSSSSGRSSQLEMVLESSSGSLLPPKIDSVVTEGGFQGNKGFLVGFFTLRACSLGVALDFVGNSL
jgi:hypothetical protein